MVKGALIEHQYIATGVERLAPLFASAPGLLGKWEESKKESEC